MYGNCGSIQNAAQVFHGIINPDLFSWNIMLKAYAQNGCLCDVWNFFTRMGQKDVSSWNKLLNACAKYGSVENALLVFEKIPERSVVSWGSIMNAVAAPGHCIQQVQNLFDEMPQRDFVTWTAFLNALTRESSCSIVDAKRAFEKMPAHGIYPWNILLLGYIMGSQSQVALDLFSKITQERSSMVDDRTFVVGFKACARVARESHEEGRSTCKFLETGMALHAKALNFGLDCCSNLFLASTLIDMYSSCGSLIDARRIFDRMHSHDVVSWNALLMAYAQNHEEKCALDLLELMTCSPDRLTFAAAVRACSSLAVKEADQEISAKNVKIDSLKRGLAVHSLIVRRSGGGVELIDSLLASSLIDMYSKCGSMIDARSVFDRIPIHGSSIDDAAVLWTSLLLGYAESSEGEIAVELFWKLQELGDQGGETFRESIFLAAIKACGSIARSPLRSIHGEACRQGMIHGQCGQWADALETALVDCYAKAGDLKDARRIFDSCKRNPVTWNALIGGYARHGDVIRAFELFFQMHDEGLAPDSVTLLSILTLCNHMGLVDQGKKIFEAMILAGSGIRVGIEHYHCVIDLLGRSNRISEAVAMIRSMPFEPNAVTWRTLLSACGKWRNREIARDAFQSLMKLDHRDTAGHDLIAKLFLTNNFKSS
ncbi:pentatricopeptide repeat-containing protein At1g03540-like [Selaginella moellendorffii]|uniref:pentatricopeptide repeat-containing protein At1g03540-like n=1 Tax=Selaginella moellendorffii TaxID=88036 RepID=UPI000D1C3B01|nr:pentatricopeptide repeat-containing protein At1g03540-like [Selaginella moellendorffii]|eukprot:XP_024515304.1 pentatricopeptide repeat-containing protein At1g03540-like [Selaginella moellendorffii]